MPFCFCLCFWLWTLTTMQQSPSFTALLVLLMLIWLPIDAEARPEFDFRACGGVKACLGSKLERARRRSGQTHRSAEELAYTVDTDHDLGVDTTNDMLVYACQGLVAAAPLRTHGHHRHQHHHRHHRHLMQYDPQPTGSEIASGWMPSMPDASLTVAQTFSLHSRPNSTRKIFLDFDGHNTTGTAWNAAYARGIITTPPFDKDGNPNSWSAQELSDILAIWRGVSEDYAPFDVDVTTADPGAAYLATNGVRAAIGGSSYDWYGSGAGGIAYVGIFGKYNNYYQPAFIFPAQLGGGNAKYVWEAVAHEVGHTVGLSHDGTTGGVGYYSGQGDWAPIMGVGYYKSVTQWSKGEYANSNNAEDDYTVMSTYLGSVTAIPQEHGSDRSTATPLSGIPDASSQTATARASGIIRSPSDVEMFSLTASAAGNATLDVLPAAPWGTVPRSDLRTSLIVTDSLGTQLATTSGVGISSLNVSLPAAGVYYISLTGAGSGNAATTGYSSYGSRGAYELVVTYPSDWSTSTGMGTNSMYTFSPTNQSPTPSPSPEPSASPLPTPSPPPSPSPKTSSSPSPTPLPAMIVSSISLSKSTSRQKVTCTAKVTIVASGSSLKLGNVTVTGVWSSLVAAAGWPSPAVATTATSGNSLGVATITAGATLPSTRGRGQGCTFTVQGATAKSYALDTATNQPPGSLTW